MGLINVLLKLVAISKHVVTFIAWQFKGKVYFLAQTKLPVTRRSLRPLCTVCVLEQLQRSFFCWAPPSGHPSCNISSTQADNKAWGRCLQVARYLFIRSPDIWREEVKGNGQHNKQRFCFWLFGSFSLIINAKIAGYGVWGIQISKDDEMKITFFVWFDIITPSTDLGSAKDLYRRA